MFAFGDIAQDDDGATTSDGSLAQVEDTLALLDRHFDLNRFGPCEGFNAPLDQIVELAFTIIPTLRVGEDGLLDGSPHGDGGIR